MNRLFILVFILGGLGINNSWAQDDLRLWSPNKKLSWGDFKGRLDSLSRYQALTYSRVQYTVEQEAEGYINFKIVALFNRSKSWSKDKLDENLLRHENFHFDLTELCTRKIRKEFDQYSLTEKEKAYEELNAIFDKYSIDFFDSMNYEYDVETDHGTLAEKQKEWESKIAEELKALDKYASTTVVVKKKSAKSTSRKKKKWWKFC